jgi:hypothetical protein
MAFVDAALAVGTAVGADALGAGAATMIGGGLMGAGIGGIGAALTGGNIGQGMLLGGGLGAGGAGLLGAGTAAAPAVAEALPGVGVGGAAPIATGAVAPGSIGSSSIPFASDSAQMAQDLENGANAGVGTGSTIPDVSNSSSGFLSGIPTWAKYGAGALGLGALMQNGNKKYGTISNPASNPLPYASNFGTYKPLDTTVMRPMGAPSGPYTGTPYGAPGYTGSQVGYAEGGIADANPMGNPSVGPVEQMSRDNALGQNQMFPQANINSPAFSSATNTPMGTNMIAAAGDTNVDPYTGAERFAMGGITGHSTLGGYAAGGNPRLLKGPGDGMSDNIPATIGDKQPARLADGEFVVPADVVSHLGNGSTDAGAKHLYNMMDKVRAARTGNRKQGKEIKADKFLPK